MPDDEENQLSRRTSKGRVASQKQKNIELSRKSDNTAGRATEKYQIPHLDIDEEDLSNKSK